MKLRKNSARQWHCNYRIRVFPTASSSGKSALAGSTAERQLPSLRAPREGRTLADTLGSWWASWSPTMPKIPTGQCGNPQHKL